MRGACGKGRGQSLVEYMLIAGALIGLCLVQLKPRIEWRMLELMVRAKNQMLNPSPTADAIIPSLWK